MRSLSLPWRGFVVALAVVGGCGSETAIRLNIASPPGRTWSIPQDVEVIQVSFSTVEPEEILYASTFDLSDGSAQFPLTLTVVYEGDDSLPLLIKAFALRGGAVMAAGQVNATFRQDQTSEAVITLKECPDPYCLCGCQCNPDDLLPCVTEAACPGAMVCTGEHIWGICEAVAAPEDCLDGLDNDCDGLVDGEDGEDCLCFEGEVEACIEEGSCGEGQRECWGGTWGPCQGEFTDPLEEVCDGLDNDCDGAVDEGMGGVMEVCDGLDNNCNGEVDEGLQAPGCGLTKGVCQSVRRVCRGEEGWAECVAEDYGLFYEAEEGSCDGLDNDCDGLIDEGCPCEAGGIQPCGLGAGICQLGVQFCESGSWGPCLGTIEPRPELCNGLDDDCDGLTDEGCLCEAGERLPCGFPMVGECRPGFQECGEEGRWVECQGALGPVPDICDGLDNDCDGAVDEGCGCDVGETKECGLNVGACRRGIQTCLAGAWGPCEGAIEPSNEICGDGQDNDCDSLTDEGCLCDAGDEVPCGTSDVGACVLGVQTCSAQGEWGECRGAVEPTEEVCDEVDNDCDGEVDEEPLSGLDDRACPLREGVCLGAVHRCYHGQWICDSLSYGELYEKNAEISCDGQDNDCDGVVDEADDLLTSPCPLFVGVCTRSTHPCVGGLEVECDYGDQYALDEEAMEDEDDRCDFRDNDCDGQVDEGCYCTPGLTEPCGTDVGACEFGSRRCGSDLIWEECVGGKDPVPEECNSIDDDCDGEVDEGNLTLPCPNQLGVCLGHVVPCEGGVWAACDPSDVAGYEAYETTCDGLDNDCDGLVDETLIPEPCSLQQGVCQGAVKVCGDQGWLPCTAASYGPDYLETEVGICDGQDNDCDGVADEGCTCSAGETGECGTDEGECEPGRMICAPTGEWGPCEGGMGPYREECDGLDNDCDGLIDEEESLWSFGCEWDQGVCVGSWKSCNQYLFGEACNEVNYGPDYEGTETRCDGLDNDCDGQVDEACTGLCSPCSSEGVCGDGGFVCGSYFTFLGVGPFGPNCLEEWDHGDFCPQGYYSVLWDGGRVCAPITSSCRAINALGRACEIPQSYRDVSIECGEPGYKDGLCFCLPGDSACRNPTCTIRCWMHSDCPSDYRCEIVQPPPSADGVCVLRN